MADVGEARLGAADVAVDGLAADRLPRRPTPDWAELLWRHRRRKARLHAILGIPAQIETAAIIPLGWPDRDDGPNRRPPLAQFVRYDRWAGSTAWPPRSTRA